MPRPYLPDAFQTEIDGKIFRVKTETGSVLMSWDLRHLSNKMLNGERIDAAERALAGAALSHLLATSKD